MCRFVLGSVASIVSALYVRREEWMLGRVGERRMRRVRKTEKDEERETEGAKHFLFVFIWDIYDRPVSVDQSRRKLHLTRAAVN